MAAIGKIRFNWRGEWVSGTSYLVDDIVSYKGEFYICNTDTSDTTNPQSRLGTNDDDVGSVGTVWTLYSVGGLGGDANRGADGYANVNFLTSDYSHGHLSNSHYRSGTYYFGDTATYIDADGIMGTYRVKVASTTNAPTNTTDWDRIAWGGNLYSRSVTTHPDYVHAFPNEGYILDPATNWSRDVLGWANSGAWTPYYRTFFVNKHLGLSGPPVFQQAGGCGAVMSDQYQYNSTMEYPFHHREWEDDGLTTSDGEAPKPVQMILGTYTRWVLFNNGEVHACGYNTVGQLGIGTTVQNYPSGFVRCGYANVNRTGETTVLKNKKAIRIAATPGSTPNTNDSVYALIDNGDSTNTLYSWGYNGYGQLGHGNTTNLNVPTAITWDAATNGKIIDVWASGVQFCSVFIYTDTDKMFAAGYNNAGNLGVGDTANKSSFTLTKDWSGEGGFKKFAQSGGYNHQHCMFISGNGKLWSWGENNLGQLGQGDTTDRTSPTQVGSDTDWQNVWCMGYSTTSGISFACKGASRFSNSLYACGYGGHYALGTGTTSNQNTFTASEDADGNQLTNIIKVREISGGYPSGALIGVEKYLADTEFNQSWYKTKWYNQGYTSGSGTNWVGYTATTASYNYHQQDSVVNSTDRYHYQDNFYYPPGINPYRCEFVPAGYNQFTASVFVYDRDVGRIFQSGYLLYNSPVHTYTDAAPTTADALNGGWQFQPLPYC